MSTVDTLIDLEVLGIPAQINAKVNSDFSNAGQIPPGLLPDLSAVTPYVVNNEAEMLAIPATGVSLAIRTDGGSFILVQTPASNFANWRQLVVPNDVVASFNGRKGDVFPIVGDYSAEKIVMPTALLSFGQNVAAAINYVYQVAIGGTSGGSGGQPSGGSGGSLPSNIAIPSLPTIGAKYFAFAPYSANLSQYPVFAPYSPL